MTRQQQFTRKVQELIRQSRSLSPAARRNVLELLDEARKRIVADLASLPGDTFQAAQLRQLRASVEAAFEDFGRGATAAVGRMQETGFRLGVATVEQPIAAAGFPMPALGGISRTTLSIVQGYTADLIEGLSADSAARVNASIQRAFLGGQSVQDVINQVGRALSGDQGFSGVFGPVGERASTIAINEVLRVHSISAQARLEELHGRHPELKKQWQWIPAARVPRIEHQAASGQVVEVDEPFEVGGEELMYPRDPAGSPENTINCHCVLKPFFDAAALKPTPGQEQLLKDLGISVEITQAAAAA